MRRKIVSSLLIVSFLSYIGCYSTETVPKQELAAKQIQGDITVIMKDRMRFVFGDGKYSISSDSLSGIGGRKTADYFVDLPFQGSLALADIMFIERKEFSTGKTILLAGAAVGLVALIASSSPPSSGFGGTLGGGMSCPFIYTYDGSEYHFESETFAGAVFKGVERTSCDVLRHLKAVEGECKIRLVNARDETEYVDQLTLTAVDHPRGTLVIPDRNGVMHTISDLAQPTTCVDFRGRNTLAAIDERDGSYWQSDLTDRDWANDFDLRDGIIVEFPKRLNAKSVKLVVNGRNTRLGYFALANIFQLKGSEKLDWYSELEISPAERAKFVRWMMREGMLHIHVWQGEKWIEQSALLDVGPGISKDQVAVLDISDVKDDVLRVRLECTTDLWRIDQVYVDYSPDFYARSTALSLRSAINEQSQDVADLLNVRDERYYATVNDQYADIVFVDTPRNINLERTYVVNTTGYYYQWLDADGTADHELVERILTEPMFGAKLLLPQWEKERGAYEGISNRE